MAEHGSIDWTDTTRNPVTGCTKISAGGDNFYAGRFSERFRGVPGNPFETGFDLTLILDTARSFNWAIGGMLACRQVAPSSPLSRMPGLMVLDLAVWPELAET
jgi:Protein of unknown function (DUF5131)